MQRLKKTGKIKTKSSNEITHSRIGIGFEKLDRGAFDPEKAYDFVAGTGVKWVRLQSGWAKTEKGKGVYDFKWLDTVVDNLISGGLTPWLCLCYGNALYDENAAQVFGSVGCPPIHTAEQKEVWDRYVRAVVEHYKGRITHYEVWNEPDGVWCWKHGPSGKELGEFTIATARAIKETDETAFIIGGSVCKRQDIGFLNDAFKTGMGNYIDALTFHEYTHDETLVFERVRCLRALIDLYNPDIKIIQGESGSQSRMGGAGAIRFNSWTEEKQSKQLARHTMIDLMTEAMFTSYFSCLDMAEALNGIEGDKNSYKDFAYFGVLGADFDEDGIATGEYKPKPSYYTLQNIASCFGEDAKPCDLPVVFRNVEKCTMTGENALGYNQMISGGFVKDNGSAAFVYWTPTNILTQSYEGVTSLRVVAVDTRVRLLDVMDGSIYEIPESILKYEKTGVMEFEYLPVKDTPLVLLFGDFCEMGEA